MAEKTEKPKSPAGRKKKPEAERLSVQFMVRITTAQDAFLGVIARESNKDRSDVLRDALNDYFSAWRRR